MAHHEADGATARAGAGDGLIEESEFGAQSSGRGPADGAVVGLCYPLDLRWEGRVWDAEGCGACFAEEDVARLEEGGEGGPEVRLGHFGGGDVVFLGPGREGWNGGCGDL